MKRALIWPEPDLFEDGGPPAAVPDDQKRSLVLLIQAMLSEITAAAAPALTKRRAAMTKIMPEHLARGAFVYVRQSTADQLLHNHESRRRQYGLADRARQLGWQEVAVIDDDLGRSGSGVSRPGFERLLAAICEGRAGAVFAIEASRLARNGRDWHTLIEFCGLVGTIIIDEDGIYEPRHPNDRLLLGMKGTMSELELSILRQRSLEALRQKARRGELFLTVAIGYVKVRHDRIAKDPDQRVREAIALVFSKFAEFQSIRQVHLWFRQERIALPAVNYTIADGRNIVWKLPVYNTVHHILKNPIYAGAYAFGRTGSRVTIEAGRKRIVRGYKRERAEWDVLLKDHHEGYCELPFLRHAESLRGGSGQQLARQDHHALPRQGVELGEHAQELRAHLVLPLGCDRVCDLGHPARAARVRRE